MHGTLQVQDAASNPTGNGQSSFISKVNDRESQPPIFSGNTNVPYNRRSPRANRTHPATTFDKFTFGIQTDMIDTILRNSI